MTVTTTQNSILYAGNGTTTAFAFPYIFFAPTDLFVTLADSAALIEIVPPPVLNGGATYDYTLTGDFENGEYASGATITFNTAPPAGTTVAIVRAVPAIQTVTLIDNTKFPADTINTEFDYLTVLTQQTSAVTAVALHIPDSEAGLTVRAAPAGIRANKILTWDAAGNLTHSEQTIGDIEDVNIGVFDELYVNVTGDNMSGPLSVPFLTTNNATINTSMQVMPGGTAKAPTPGVNDVSTNLATTAWVVGFLGAQGQGEAVWEFAGSTAGDPGTGGLIIDPGVDIVREITMAKLDADGVARFLIAMRAGDAMVITNEFTPVTQYARYTLISDVTDNGTWVQFTAHLNDSSSPMEGPPLGTRMRVTGFLNTMAGGADISGVAAGYGLTGGGDSGTIPIAADPTVLAPLANPVFTGDPMAPTPGTGDNDESIATTRFVKNQGYVSTTTLAGYLPLTGGALAGPGNLSVGGTLTGLTASFTGAVKAANVAIPAGGTIGAGLMFSTTPDFGLVFGSGIPNKAMPKGTVYLRSDGTGTPYYSSDGTAGGWLQIGSGGGGAAVHVGTSPPSTPTDGMMWFYTDASVGGGSLYIYYNDLFGSPQWVPTSPQPTSPVPGTLYLYSEKVCVGGETFMDVPIPAVASIKRLELEYSQRCATAADPNMVMNVLESGVPNTTSNYSWQGMYQSATSVSSGGANSITSWLMSGGRQATGQIQFYVVPGGVWYATHRQYLITTTSRYQQFFSYDFPPANIALTTGFRIALASSSFQAGSFMRCYVVT